MLIHWLPLNGDIKDYGMNAKTWRSTGITYADGQLGKAAVFDGDASKKIWLENPEENQRLTWACWVKVNSVGVYQSIISQGRNYQIYGLNIFIPVDGKINVHYGSENNLTSINPVTAGETFHIAVTADENYVTLYINGEKHAQDAKKYFDYEYSQDTLVIGKMAYGYSSDTQYFPFDGTISDVRIYDNCLSPTEIKELSKGLIVHYPLSSIYESGIRNKYSGEEAAGKLSGSTIITKIPLTDEKGYNYKLFYTGTGANTWPNLYLTRFSFTPGKTYYYSCKVRCNSKSNDMPAFKLRAARSDNDYGTGFKDINVLNADGKWHEYVLSQVINETYERNDGTITCNPRVEFYSDNLNGEGTLYTFDIDIKDIQVVESDYEVPFIENELCDTVVYDVSGNNYHGSVELNTAPVWNPDSKINDGSFYFDGTIHINLPELYIPEQITVSLWVKSKLNTAWGRLIALQSEEIYNSSTSNYIGLCQNPNSNNIGVNIYNNGSKMFDIYPWTNIDEDEWYHIAFTLYQNEIKAYKNGELVSNETAPSLYVSRNSYYNCIGSNGSSMNSVFTGNLSDIRIYATVLSDSDIKALYNKRFSIDDKGAFYSSAFQEIELSSTTKMVNLIDENKINLIASDGDLVTSAVVENKEVNLSNTGIISSGEFIEMGSCDFIEKASGYTEYWTPTTANNSNIFLYNIDLDNLNVGDIIVVELDFEWNGFDESNTDGTFYIYFQCACYKHGDETEYWETGNISDALNKVVSPKTLVLGSTVGYYHYIAEATIIETNKEYNYATIGIRSDYSNGTGTIRITNGHVYKKSDYLGNEKTRFDSYVESKEFIENF